MEPDSSMQRTQTESKTNHILLLHQKHRHNDESVAFFLRIKFYCRSAPRFIAVDTKRAVMEQSP